MRRTRVRRAKSATTPVTPTIAASEWLRRHAADAAAPPTPPSFYATRGLMRPHVAPAATAYLPDHACRRCDARVRARPPSIAQRH